VEPFVAADEYEDQPAERPPVRLQCAPGVRLLVLDDDAAICRLVQAALAEEEFAVEAVSDPRKVEAKLKSGPYHLIILDYVIPGLEPDRMLALVREHQPDAGVIVVTAYPSMDSALHCLRSHTYDYLTKPFQVEHLQRSVRRCLESKGLLRLTEEGLREQLGAEIRERRKSQGLTLKEMADRTGMSLGYLSQIELGKNSGSVETLYRIALALRVRLVDLFQSLQSDP
jgi:DNA-binding response OmpR family regulator